MRLEFEAEHCPQVPLRVLGLLEQRRITPLSLAASWNEDGIALAVVIEGLPAEQAEALVAGSRLS